jgi:hypothetical protein
MLKPVWIALSLLLALPSASLAAEGQPAQLKPRRILYNLDGDSCLTLKAGRTGPGPITGDDLRAMVAELTQPGSQVDTLLLCVNAQVMYYPTRVGTLRGTLSTPEERAQWSSHEQQRFANLQTFFDAGTDPYALIFAEARQRGLETFLTFCMNDGHGNDFLRTAFWRDHPQFRLNRAPNDGALDFTHETVRDYVFRLIAEAAQRYDCDGIELDFQRFPTFFGPNSADSAETRVAKINSLVERVRGFLDTLGAQRGRRLLLAARVPSDYGRSIPTYEMSRALGSNPAAWARAGWIDFLTVSEWLFTADTLGIKAWKQSVSGVPIYAGVQPETKPSSNPVRREFCLGAGGYRKFAGERWADHAEGIYLFNFFTTREWKEPLEPPFEVLSGLAGPSAGGPWPELEDVRKIWDAAPHNAFTDLLRHDHAWFCVFREGSGHIPGTNGLIRVLRSEDGNTWESAALLGEPGVDLRDPKLSVCPDGRLMLLMGGSVYAGAEGLQDRSFVSARTRVAFSPDGCAWTQPQVVSLEGEWLWRVTWHEGIGYGMGYTFYVPARDVSLTLWRTRDGINYEKLAAPKPPSECWPDETSLRFLADDTMVALVRNEQARGPAFVGTSRPPYTEWRWQNSGHVVQGPNLVVLPGDRMFYAGRDYRPEPVTAFGSLTPAGAKRHFTLPSGGDTSYPGMVWHEGRLWISYYASHQGKAAIYLAKIRVPNSDAGKQQDYP